MRMYECQHTSIEDVADDIVEYNRIVNQVSCKETNEHSSLKYIELIDMFREVTGKNLQVIKEDPRPGDIAVMFADSEHAHSKLHWESTKTLRDMVQSTVSLYGV